MDNTFNSIEQRLKPLKEMIGLTDTEINLLLNHKQISYQELEVDGEKLPAWRIIHNNVLGPGKGGIRFHPQVSEDEVKSLSFWMSLKNSLAGLPYGGAKGGIKFDPKGKTPEQLEKISRAYIDSFYKVLGQDKDIPAPDVYTNSQIMAWMLDQYEKNVGHHEPGMITGKPVELQGSVLRGDATAEGGLIVINEMVKKISKHKSEIKVAVQGFGNAGSFIAQKLDKEGYKVVSVSDSRTGIYNENGLDTNDVTKVKQETKSLENYEKAIKITNAELLELDVDILVLAALENQITEENAFNIKADYLVELANGPITFEADKILFANNKIVVPDILANAGGVVVSYFEWAQNRAGNLFDNEYLKKKLVSIMTNSWNNVSEMQIKENNKFDLRTMAYIIAIKRILEAGKLRGNL